MKITRLIGLGLSLLALAAGIVPIPVYSMKPETKGAFVIAAAVGLGAASYAGGQYVYNRYFGKKEAGISVAQSPSKPIESANAGLGALIGSFPTENLFSLCEFKDQTIDNVTVKHIRVLRQKDGVSCGYHAYKNALFGCNLRQMGDDLKNHDHLLSEQKYNKKYCLWAPVVADFRLKKSITENLKKNFRDKLVINDALPNFHILGGKVVDQCAILEAERLIVNRHDSSVPKAVTSREFNTHFEAIVPKLMVNDAKISDDMSKKLINYLKAQLKDTCVQMDSHIKDVLASQEQMMLEGDEIKSFMESSDENRMTVCDDITQLEAVLASNNQLKEDWKTKSMFLHAFIVGTMSEENRSSGHWFTLLLEKKNHEKNVYVLDSCNSERTDFAQKILNMLNT